MTARLGERLQRIEDPQSLSIQCTQRARTGLCHGVLAGSVILGVGLASVGGMRAPRSHLGLLLFLACYKGLVVVLLLAHGLTVLFGID